METEFAAGQRVGVIIVNLNGHQTLLAAVRSAGAEGVPEANIVIVDNGSEDDSLQQVADALPGVALLCNGKNAGFAAAANRGIGMLSRRKPDLFLLLNNDAELCPGALAAFAQAFGGRPRLAIAGGQLSYPDGRLQSAFAPLPSLLEEIVPVNFLKWTRPERYRRSTSEREIRPVESVFGACLAVRAAALDTFGLLDEDFFFYFEEVEWCRRARLAGWEVFYVPEARAVHVLGGTTTRYRNEARVELQRSKLLYFQKCRPPWEHTVLSAMLLLRTLVNAVSGSIACVFTLGVQRKIRRNTRAYWYMFAWHTAGRPASWGLPGKVQTGQTTSQRCHDHGHGVSPNDPSSSS